MATRCQSNNRCEACPIERIEPVSDRLLVADVLGATQRDIQTNVDDLTLKQLRDAVNQKAEMLNMDPRYTNVVVAAGAITITKACD